MRTYMLQLGICRPGNSQSNKKNINISKAHDVFAWARSLKITTVGLFMIGFPEETVAQAKKTIRLASQIKTDYMICQILMPVYDTDLFKDAIKDSTFDAEFYMFFLRNPHPDATLPIWSTSISEQELLRLQRLFYLKFYFRPGYILRTM
jgi:anaerobic magnesium-protoporphyrin IX monomethyl ester cyclase